MKQNTWYFRHTRNSPNFYRALRNFGEKLHPAMFFYMLAQSREGWTYMNPDKIGPEGHFPGLLPHEMLGFSEWEEYTMSHGWSRSKMNKFFRGSFRLRHILVTGKFGRNERLFRQAMNMMGLTKIMRLGRISNKTFDSAYRHGLNPIGVLNLANGHPNIWNQVKTGSFWISTFSETHNLLSNWDYDSAVHKHYASQKRGLL